MVAIKIPCVSVSARWSATVLFLTAHAAQAQGARTEWEWGWGARATAVVTRVDPASVGKSFTEGYLAQPHLFGHARFLSGKITAVGTLDLEGLTLERGELNPGAYGEGYVDRRHPHAYVHELVTTVQHEAGNLGASLSAGRGFASFGTDDPMARPFVKFPVNHHQAQLIERVLAHAALRWGRVVGELSVFNGDEPVTPGSSPNFTRFGDSWATRATMFPVRGLEVAGSIARVRSPESFDAGSSLDQRKWSAAVRFENTSISRRPYAMLEWSRTDDYSGAEFFFRFTSVLAEGAMNAGKFRIATRLERTTRPEEERLENIFRTARPPRDFNIIGLTRWEIASLAMSGARPIQSNFLEGANIGVDPFIEVSYSHPSQALRPSLFVPRLQYGSDNIWTFSAGLRLYAGSSQMRHGRHGRYGVAAAPAVHDREHTP